ncbi:TPA: hypothetical protein ACH3X1_005997 [Trebouxia sp. C0004]
MIRSLFSDPIWAAGRSQPKDDSPGSLYGATMCQSINAECGGRLMHQDSGGYAIGFDFCQIFNFKTHSSGLMFLRTKRSIMRERGKKIRLTAEFGRPYKCIVDSFKSYKLDDWLHFLEIFSLILPESMLSYNLHILVCRLKKQEEAKGCVARCGELWVERGIQDVKSNVKYRTTSCPEKLYVHDLMRDEALLEMQHDDCIHACVRTAVKTFDELVPEYRANIRAGPLYDLGDTGNGTQLIGKGNTLKGDAHSEALQFVAKYVDRMGHSQWAELSTDLYHHSVDLCLYIIAHKRGDELMWSVAHKRSRSRVSFYAKLRFNARTGGKQLFIAEILHFLRAINPDGNVLRLAVCKVYAARYRSSSTDIMSASLNTPKTLAVEVSELDTKLVTAKEGNTLYGMVCSNTSGMA